MHVGSVHQAAYTKTNVGLTYHAPQDTWTLGLWARNLENRAQIGPANALGGFTNAAAGSPGGRLFGSDQVFLSLEVSRPFDVQNRLSSVSP